MTTPSNNRTSSRFKLSILIALTLVALGIYFTVSRLSGPVEEDLMSDFKTSQPVLPASSSAVSTNSLAPVEELLVGLKQRLEAQPDDVDREAHALHPERRKPGCVAIREDHPVAPGE